MVTRIALLGVGTDLYTDTEADLDSFVEPTTGPAVTATAVTESAFDAMLASFPSNPPGMFVKTPHGWVMTKNGGIYVEEESPDPDAALAHVWKLVG